MQTVRIRAISFATLTFAVVMSGSPAVAQVGGQGGNPLPPLNCNNNEYMVGATGSTGWYVDEITVHCAPLAPDGRWGDTPESLPTAGQPGAESYSRMCADGSVVIAISGNAAAYVDSIALTCAPVDGDPSTTLAAVGGLGGNPFTLPSNASASHAINGISGRADWWIDQLDVSTAEVCIPIPPTITLTEPADQTALTTAQPAFSWDTGFDETIGTRYELCISPSGSADCSILHQTGLSSTSYTPSEPIDFGDELFALWQVRAQGTCGQVGDWTAPQSVLTGNLQDQPQPEVLTASADYRPLCAVYQDDRCAKCHNVGQFPANHPPANQACTGCHQDAIHPETNSAVWQFAPNDQQFTSPVTCGEICETVRDWAIEHEGDDHDFIFHVTLDPLIKWGFEPQPIQNNQALPPVQEMTHTQYASLSTQWMRDGYPCNVTTDDFPGFGDEIAVAGTNGGGGGDGNGFDLPDIDLTKFGPPRVDRPKPLAPVWWIDPKVPPADRSELTKQQGLPPECRRLIVATESKTLIESRLTFGRPPTETSLLKTCRKLLETSKF